VLIVCVPMLGSNDTAVNGDIRNVYALYFTVNQIGVLRPCSIRIRHSYDCTEHKYGAVNGPYYGEPDYDEIQPVSVPYLAVNNRIGRSYGEKGVGEGDKTILSQIFFVNNNYITIIKERLLRSS
jgi:hypothetical protein